MFSFSFSIQNFFLKQVMYPFRLLWDEYQYYIIYRFVRKNSFLLFFFFIFLGHIHWMHASSPCIIGLMMTHSLSHHYELIKMVPTFVIRTYRRSPLRHVGRFGQFDMDPTSQWRQGVVMGVCQRSLEGFALIGDISTDICSSVHVWLRVNFSLPASGEVTRTYVFLCYMWTCESGFSCRASNFHFKLVLF